MFNNKWRKKYEELVAETLTLTSLTDTLIQQNRDLTAEKDYYKGQVGILKSELQRRVDSGSAQFSAEEIRVLLSLCHPDKHGGKSSATKITKKLLILRT